MSERKVISEHTDAAGYTFRHIELSGTPRQTRWLVLFEGEEISHSGHTHLHLAQLQRDYHRSRRRGY